MYMYIYANGNPIALADPNGTQPWDDIADVVSEVADAAVDAASTATSAAVTAGTSVAAVNAWVTEETWDRASTYVQYQAQVQIRRWTTRHR